MSDHRVVRAGSNGLSNLISIVKMKSNEAHQKFDQWRKESTHRFTNEYVEVRLLKEQRKMDFIIKQESKLKHRLFSPRSIVTKLLSITGLKSVGRKQACRIKLNHNDLKVAKLPNSFHGYKILHVSDPHFNGFEELTANMLKKINEADYDYCVLTGDYRYRSFGEMDFSIQGLREIRRVVNKDIVAILGNHDSIQMVPLIEALGIRVLLNEHLQIEKNNDSLYLVGVDDPSYYRTHDLSKAIGSTLSMEDKNVCSLLLAHSPNLLREASKAGINAYLCGHTHGGQICLPGGVPLLKDSKLPRHCIAGDWQYEAMIGYTSVGVGASVVEARFFCPPEITVHTLIRA